MQLPTLSLVFIVLDILLGLAVPIALFVYLRRRFRLSALPFFIGCAVMLIFAFGLEQGLHALVMNSVFGFRLQTDIWLLALYGGLAAGLFEEGGRYLAMRFLLRKQHDDPHNALLYGAGHGGFEMMAILVLTMVSNLVLYVILKSPGAAETMLAAMPEAGQQSLQTAFAALAGTSPWLFLLSLLERLAALAAQLSLSVLVWFAVTRPGRGWLFFLAVGLHLFLDAAVAVLNGLGLPPLLLELVVCLIAAAYVLLARRLWRQLAPAPTEECLQETEV